jgi:large subunit ribosomal protein L15
VKILARGKLTKALTVRAHKFSAKAQEEIGKAGGKAEVIEG